MTVKTYSPWITAALVACLMVCIVPLKSAVNSTPKLRTEPATYNPADFASSSPPVAVVPAKVDQREVLCLTDAVYHEAGGEPTLGKAAVAKVIINRTQDGKFPRTVCGVVHQRNNGKCQFSYLCVGSHYYKDPEVWAESRHIAEQVLSKREYKFFMPNALYYHAVYVNPNWHLPRIQRIGQHIFYASR